MASTLSNDLSAAATTTSSASATQTPFTFPKDYNFPPFFTPQTNHDIRLSQLSRWSDLIRSYCRHNRIFRLSLIDAVENSPLFHNARMGKRVSLVNARAIVDWMASPEGGRRAEWDGGGEGRSGEKPAVWIWWKRPEEWAEVLAGWVEETGQKNTVLTLYELIEGEATNGQEFHGMDPIVLQRSLHVLVRQGKAQVFGHEGQQGVKFF
ncbi:hypothetical protein FQN54_002068 [Arachnomyces sp. PD_36]|nr:hypothetical protein FQN54_002068 [Arachnomyces sp. PD_36]